MPRPLFYLAARCKAQELARDLWVSVSRPVSARAARENEKIVSTICTYMFAKMNSSMYVQLFVLIAELSSLIFPRCEIEFEEMIAGVKHHSKEWIKM